jgi:hypothetical protein
MDMLKKGIRMAIASLCGLLAMQPLPPPPPKSKDPIIMLMEVHYGYFSPARPLPHLIQWISCKPFGASRDNLKASTYYRNHAHCLTSGSNEHNKPRSYWVHLGLCRTLRLSWSKHCLECPQWQQSRTEFHATKQKQRLPTSCNLLIFAK